MDERTGQRFQTRPGNGNQSEGAAKNQISAPSISLPKGGGAIRGMGERFAANPVAGTGSMTAHSRGTSWYIPNCHGTRNILRAALAGESTARHKLGPKDNRFNPRQSMTTANIGPISTMLTEYKAQILKLDLPEQDTLKNDAERCSADPGMLQSIGRDVGHQVRIKRVDADNPGFLALYTVAQARIATENDNPKFQGRSADNLINRLAAQGIHIEQSGEARKFSEQIAEAIATVYRSPIRRFLCALANLFR